MNKKSMPKKDYIMAQAARIFSERGYGRTTMKDIGRACRCEASNIYNYFPSKEVLLYEILKEEMEQLLVPLRHLLHDNETDPSEQLKFMLKHHLNLVLGTRRTYKAIFESEFKFLRPRDKKRIIELRDEFEKIMQTILQRGIAKGIFSQLDVKMTSYLIISMITRVRTWYNPHGRLTINEIAEAVFNLTMNGMASGK
jgi:AcrR family transcriptional regulator